jgi:hypothetical protein
MKRALLLALLGLFAFGGLAGCEANIDADDDKGRFEIDVDD